MSEDKKPFYKCHDFYHGMPEDFRMTASYSTNQLMQFADNFHKKEMQNRLEDMLEEMCGVLPEHHREIVEDELNNLKNQNI